MSLRLRLTAVYAGVFVLATVALLGVSYWLMGRQFDRTLDDPRLADEALRELGGQYLLGLGGMVLVGVALGWAVAGRALRPLRSIADTAGRVSDERLGLRVAGRGPRDEVREVADAFDSMLDRLEEAVDAQRRFVANASHELRRPLTVIRTEADVTLADPDASKEELRAMGLAVLEATDRTDALLDGLLVLARARRGGLRSEAIDLGVLARRAAAAVSREAAARGVVVKVSGGATVPGDEALLDRLVTNLVENAVRHGAREGEVELSVGESPRGATVRVVNAGRVLEPALLLRLTEPFERDGRADISGAGLGLSIVRAVAEAHGGALDLQPRPGGGLDARVTLPRWDANDQPG